MVYVDGLLHVTPSPSWRWPQSCHLFADSIGELHDFAVLRLGMSRSWFQNDPRLPHYDLTPGRRRRAVHFGARQVPRTFVAARMRLNLAMQEQRAEDAQRRPDPEARDPRRTTRQEPDPQ